MNNLIRLHLFFVQSKDIMFLSKLEPYLKYEFVKKSKKSLDLNSITHNLAFIRYQLHRS